MSQEHGRVPGRVPSPEPVPAAPPWSAPDTPRTDGSSPGVRPALAPGVAGATAATRSSPPRPSGIPLRPLGVGDILDGTFTTIRHNPRATVGLAALLVTVQQALVVAVQLLVGGLPTTADLGSAALSLQLVGGYEGVLGALVSAVVGAVLTGMLVVVVSEDVLGRRVTVGQVWTRIRGRLVALLVASAFAGLLPYVGLVALVIPGVILWVGWSLTTPALVIEGIGPFRALGRSWRLAWPDFFRVLGIRLLSVLVAQLIQLLVVIPFVALGAGIGYLLGVPDGAVLALVIMVLLALGSIASGMLTEPFVAGVLALLYVDRRMRAEGLDLVIGRLRMAQRPAVRLPGAPVPLPGGGW